MPFRKLLTDSDWLHLLGAAVIALVNLVTLYVRLKNREG